MTLTTTAEFDMCGAGSGIIVEAEIAYDIDPGSRGSWDEPPSGDTAINIGVTRWRYCYGRGVWTDWHPAEGPMRAMLEASIDGEWLLEHADDDRDDCGDWRRDMRMEAAE